MAESMMASNLVALSVATVSASAGLYIASTFFDDEQIIPDIKPPPRQANKTFQRVLFDLRNVQAIVKTDLKLNKEQLKHVSAHNTDAVLVAIQPTPSNRMVKITKLWGLLRLKPALLQPVVTHISDFAMNNDPIKIGMPPLDVNKFGRYTVAALHIAIRLAIVFKDISEIASKTDIHTLIPITQFAWIVFFITHVKVASYNNAISLWMLFFEIFFYCVTMIILPNTTQLSSLPLLDTSIFGQSNFSINDVGVNLIGKNILPFIVSLFLYGEGNISFPRKMIASITMPLLLLLSLSVANNPSFNAISMPVSSNPNYTLFTDHCLNTLRCDLFPHLNAGINHREPFLIDSYVSSNNNRMRLETSNLKQNEALPWSSFFFNSIPIKRSLVLPQAHYDAVNDQNIMSLSAARLITLFYYSQPNKGSHVDQTIDPRKASVLVERILDINICSNKYAHSEKITKQPNFFDGLILVFMSLHNDNAAGASTTGAYILKHFSLPQKKNNKAALAEWEQRLPPS